MKEAPKNAIALTRIRKKKGRTFGIRVTIDGINYQLSFAQLKKIILKGDK